MQDIVGRGFKSAYIKSTVQWENYIIIESVDSISRDGTDTPYI